MGRLVVLGMRPRLLVEGVSAEDYEIREGKNGIRAEDAEVDGGKLKDVRLCFERSGFHAGGGVRRERGDSGRG